MCSNIKCDKASGKQSYETEAFLHDIKMNFQLSKLQVSQSAGLKISFVQTIVYSYNKISETERISSLITTKRYNSEE